MENSESYQTNDVQSIEIIFPSVSKEMRAIKNNQRKPVPQPVGLLLGSCDCLFLIGIKHLIISTTTNK